MAIFTTNSVRNIYVLKNEITGSGNPVSVGDYKLQTTPENKLQLLYMSYGGAISSDIIDPKTITHVKYTAGSGRAVNKAEIKLKPFTKITAGQDYVVRIKISNYYSLGSEPAMLQFGVVHATQTMVSTPSTFWTTLRNSLNANVNQGDEKLVNITVNSTNDGLIIEEIPQTSAYVRGSYSVKPVSFEILQGELVVTFAPDPSDATQDYQDTDTWAEITYGTGSTIVPNAYTIADMEHFYMGEKGDIYRNSVARIALNTQYMINDFTKNYDTLDVHFAFVDSGAQSYRSEKDILLVAENGGTADLTVLETAIKSAAGM